MSEQNKYFKFDVKGDGCEVSLIDDWDSIKNPLRNEINALTEIIIPEEFNGRKVTSIKAEGFKDHPMWSISIPDTVSHIGSSAFSGCENLTEIVIPDSVTKLDSTFAHCTNLQRVALPDKLELIGFRVFSLCRSLKQITIPQNVKEIWDFAFFNSGLTDIVIPGTVRTISRETFRACRNLSNVTLCEGVERIEADAFGSITGGINITIACESLTSISIPQSVKFVDESAFSGCPNLDRKLLERFPHVIAYLEKLDRDLEKSDRDLERDKMFDISGEKYSSVFGTHSEIEEYKMKTNGPAELFLPDLDEEDEDNDDIIPIMKVGDEAFKDSTSLEKLTIPFLYREIGESAFENCTNLRTLVFTKEEVGRTVEIGISAFANCTNLTEIIVPENVTLKFSSTSFWGCPAQPKNNNSKTSSSNNGFLGGGCCLDGLLIALGLKKGQ